MTSLSLHAISKRFGTTVALDGVSFDVRAGEVHALLGENGAGKTTLMRIAYGLEAPDSGRIVVGGEQRTLAPSSGAARAAGVNSEQLASPRVARSLGIGMVHQHFTSIPALSVAENVALVAGWRETGRRAVRRTAALIADLGLPLDPEARTGTLSVQLRQRLEIVQALAAEARVLLLDEPTAVLAPREVTELMAVIRRLAARGSAIALITHKLREVTAVADRVTVLRDGRVALTGLAAEHDAGALARAMIGADPTLVATGDERRGVLASLGQIDAGEVVPVRITFAQPDRQQVAFRAGEIVGIAAVEGNGQRELLRAIAGVQRAPHGMSLDVRGETAFIPEDRTTEALIGDFSLTENLALGHLDQLPRWLDWGAIRSGTARLIADHDVRTASPEMAATSLSGGNQQKFVLGRALERAPKVLVAEDPTRGLDIRATAAVHRRLRAAADGGACVVLHASDLDEVIDVADRVLVMHAGMLREMPRGASRASIGDAMLGIESPAR